MPVPILATKLYLPPPRPGIVPRPRLVERLNEGLAAGCKLAFVPSTWVIAISALACILVGVGGLVSPAFRGLSLPPAAPNS